MFYESIKAAWKAEIIRIGLPEQGGGEHGAIVAKGLIGLKAKFLSRAELSKLVDLARADMQNETAYYKASSIVHTTTLAVRTFGNPTADPFAYLNGYLKALEDNSVLTASQLRELRDHLAAAKTVNSNS
ncbi:MULTISPECIES: hypothetical protein [Pseudomonas]|uniref:hypothetical protein n=1 Tax=Pseudomonas TaxID=286 RepID=UPI000C88D589|nr:MULTISPECIES: hypothetical protein [Pseudomonas]PMY37689.1 hypothetical protein C1Y36_28295 [Pseudomonas sp. FW306-2-2C-D06C]